MPNQYKNKVVYNGQTLIDLTQDTATTSSVVSGKYFHLPSGERVQGTLGFVTYHVSTSEPTSSQGSDGDIWLVTE